MEKAPKSTKKQGLGKTQSPLKSSYSQFFMTRFTAEKIEEDDFIKCLDKRCIKAEVNLEKGKNGQLHYQIAYKTKGSKSFIKEQEYWKKLFPELMFDGRDYLKKAIAPKECFIYCCKEDNTFIKHIFRKGIELDVIYKYEDPFDNYTYYDWQKQIIDIIEGEICPRTIFNVVGDYNTGKTDFCKHLYGKYNTHLLEGEKRHILDEVSKCYKNTKSFVWSFAGDEVPSYDFFQTVEKVKDMFFTSHFGTRKGESMVSGNRPHLFIFSNYKLDLSKSRIDKDRFEYIFIYSHHDSSLDDDFLKAEAEYENKCADGI